MQRSNVIWKLTIKLICACVTIWSITVHNDKHCDVSGAEFTREESAN